MPTNEAIIQALQTIQAYRERIPLFISSKERDREFIKLQEQVRELGFATMDALFAQVETNKLTLLSYVDDGFKGQPFRVVRYNDNRATPFIQLRHQDLIPDTVYIGTPLIPTILATPDEYKKLNLEYCAANHIQVADCMKHATHFCCQGVVVIAMVLKDKALFRPEYLKHLVYDALIASGKEVIKENNDLMFSGKKVYGVGSFGLHNGEYKDVALIQSFLDLRITQAQYNVFLGAYLNPADAAALQQVGSLGFTDPASFVESFRTSIKKLLGNDVSFEGLTALEQETLNNAGVCF